MILSAWIIPLVLILILGGIIENTFKPRFDVTKEHDLVLWYDNAGKRDCILLFKLK